MHSIKHEWHVGEAIKMFWAHQGADGSTGDWYTGRITGRRQRDASDHASGSPWGCWLVKWDDEPDGQPYQVSPWEMQPVGHRRGSR